MLTTTLTRVSTQDRMDVAATLVDQAAGVLLEDEDPHGRQLMTAHRAATVVALLEEAGAQLRGSGAADARSVPELVEEAVLALDEISPEDRPVKLLPARAELGVLLLEVGSQS